MNCLFCEEELTSRDAKKFCNRSCSAKYNNAKRRKKRRKCLQCEEQCKTSRTIFCSRTCSHINRTADRIAKGLVTNRRTLRLYLIRVRNHQCELCNNTSWNGLPIPLELDHIDGDATNNFLVNLRLLCPNCHAQTDTYKGKNIGHGRQSRGLISK